MDTYPIRLVAEDELAAFLAVDQHASHGTPMSERAHANFLGRLELGRTLAAFDGDTIVGGTGAFSFQMRVPGAMAAVAGVSLVMLITSCAQGSHSDPTAAGSASRSPTGCQSGIASCPARMASHLSFTVMVNGQSHSLPKDGIPPKFAVMPKRDLLIKVAVTVPMRTTVTALWLGISKSETGVGPNGPIGMNPILAHIRTPLTSGMHVFKLHWVAGPQSWRTNNLHLSAAWRAKQGISGQTIADLMHSRLPASRGQGADAMDVIFPT
jgi:hypothetical protein